MSSPHLKLAKIYWKRHLKPGDFAIDATCGNGHDTVFIAKLQISSLFALDIQKDALKNTDKRLQKTLSQEEQKRITLYQKSHEALDRLPLPTSPHLIVYNLGYLPGGDKNITTRTESTLLSVTSALSILDPRGGISITCYPGHSEGEREETALLNWAQALPSHRWEVIHHRWINRLRSPSLLWIGRIQKS